MGRRGLRRKDHAQQGVNQGLEEYRRYPWFAAEARDSGEKICEGSYNEDVIEVSWPIYCTRRLEFNEVWSEVALLLQLK
jgi:hypothetical protein